jgi:hypothetical protein
MKKQAKEDQAALVHRLAAASCPGVLRRQLAKLGVDHPREARQAVKQAKRVKRRQRRHRQRHQASKQAPEKRGT